MALSFARARWGAATLLASAGLVLAQARTPEAAAQARCFGLTAAEYAAAGFDTFDFAGHSRAAFFYTGGKAVAIIGSPGDDDLSGGDGAPGQSTQAVVCGKGGADFLQGTDNADLIKGGPGNDTLQAGPDPDLLKGGADNDSLVSAIGPGPDGSRDTVNGGAGLDTCSAPGEDSIVNCESLLP